MAITGLPPLPQMPQDPQQSATRNILGLTAMAAAQAFGASPLFLQSALDRLEAMRHEKVAMLAAAKAQKTREEEADLAFKRASELVHLRGEEQRATDKAKPQKPPSAASQKAPAVPPLEKKDAQLLYDQMTEIALDLNRLREMGQDLQQNPIVVKDAEGNTIKFDTAKKLKNYIAGRLDGLSDVALQQLGGKSKVISRLLKSFEEAEARTMSGSPTGKTPFEIYLRALERATE